MELPDDGILHSLVTRLNRPVFEEIANRNDDFYVFLINLIKSRDEIKKVIDGSHPKYRYRDKAARQWLEHVIRQDLNDLTPVTTAIIEALQKCYRADVILPPIILR